ncbi:MAG: polysaccharide pyruvyl transferase family protein [Bacteroidia bacterium]|nr:polysaccharide pyruvyl transferase family protein [Bacteroidia bacterium]
MKFLLINQALFNRGDESAHKALVYNLLLKFPDCSIEVLFVGRDPEALEDFIIADRRVKYTNLPVSDFFRKTYVRILKTGLLWRWFIMSTPRKIFAKYRSADWVISSPGDASLGARYDWDHLFLLKLAQMAGSRIAYLGRSIGPFPDGGPIIRRFNHLSIKVLRKMDFISLRDVASEETAAGLGLKFSPSYDLSFLGTPLAQIPRNIREKIGHDYAVIVPNYLVQYPELRSRLSPTAIRGFYEELLRDTLEKFPRLRIVLLPQLFNGTSYIGRDMKFFQDVADAVKDERVCVIPDECSSDIHQAIYREARFVIGGSLHSIVFAINNNVPFVALCHEERASKTLARLGKTDRIVDLSGAFELRSAEKFSQQAIGADRAKLLNLDSRVAITRIMEKLDTLRPDPAAQSNAKALTASAFAAACELISTSRPSR